MQCTMNLKIIVEPFLLTWISKMGLSRERIIEQQYRNFDVQISLILWCNDLRGKVDIITAIILQNHI